MSKKSNLIERLILFGVFLIFAGLIVAFSLSQTPRKSEDTASVTSFQYKTSSKSSMPSATTNESDINDLINVNTVTAEELTELPGIGIKKAEAIIKYREENGFFKNAEDLLNVSGIGKATLDNIKDLLIFDVK